MKHFIFPITLLCFVVESCTNKQPQAQSLAPEKSAKIIKAESVQFDGIDVSHHQRNIDWNKVATYTNIQFVYIKATEGTTFKDPKYVYNTNEARRNGLKVGSYHFLVTKQRLANNLSISRV